MPIAKTEAGRRRQYRFMTAVAHGAKPYSGKGPSVEVAKKIVHETPAAKRSAYSKKPPRYRTAAERKRGE